MATTTQPRVFLPAGPTQHREASRLILLLGVVSLFADATYESYRSILGPYLGTLGANGAVVGTVAGIGELIGYGLRLGSGYLADRTGRYWGLSLIGFTLNMAAVPVLALTGRWEMVAALVFVERTGKAIRNPPRDAILSHAAGVVGRGWGFGLQEALGQIGAVVGPLAIAAALHYHVGYRTCLGTLAIPAVLTLFFLGIGAWSYPDPRVSGMAAVAETHQPLPHAFWPFLIAAALIAAGSLSFPLVSFHLRDHAVMPEKWIPALYAVAMGAHALSALGFGLLFDRLGLRTLLAICALTTPIAPLVFSEQPALLVLAMVLSGLGMGGQKAMFKATIAQMAPPSRRGFAYGCFDIGYGFSWFLGSTLMGFCYGWSIPFLVAMSLTLQLLAIPVLLVTLQWAPVAGKPGNRKPQAEPAA